MAVFNTETMQEHVDKSLLLPRISALLLGIFGVVGLTLAAIGLYGVMSYSVRCRTREIGIRLALGAEARDVFLVALRRGLLPSLLGLGIGLTLSIGLTPLMSHLLYQVRPLDVEVLALVSLALLAICSLACAVPARRATRVDPVTALRYE